MDNRKIIFLLLAVGMTVVALAPIWPSEDAISSALTQFGVRVGFMVPGDIRSHNRQMTENVYTGLRVVFIVASFVFAALCAYMARSREAWPRQALFLAIAAQGMFLAVTLLVSWDLFRYPGTWATIGLMAIAAKLSYDDLQDLG